MKDGYRVYYCLFWIILLILPANMREATAQMVIRNNPSNELRSFIETYFSSWSNKDIKKYKSHFHDKAIILFIDGGRVEQSQDLNTFLREQEGVLSQSTKAMVERMKYFLVDEDRNAATASIEWELFIDGKKIGEGVDRFTMIRDRQGNWKIVSLVWYRT